jgi:hypothetical protein
MQRSFVFNPSHYLMLALACAHAVAAVAVFFIPLPPSALILLLPVLALSMGYYSLRDALLKLNDSWIALRLEGGRAVLTNRAGEEWTVELSRASVVMPHLVVLNVVAGERRCRRSVVLLSDSMDVE